MGYIELKTKMGYTYLVLFHIYILYPYIRVKCNKYILKSQPLTTFFQILVGNVFPQADLTSPNVGFQT